MTIGWILEAAQDRLYETGSDIGESPVLNQFECSICGSIFASITEHDQHKLSHPVRTPSIFIKGSEVTSAEFDITSVIKVNDLHFHNIDFIYLNDAVCHDESEVINFIIKNKKSFINIRYGNAFLEKKLNLNICIADESEMIEAENLFLEIFSSSDFSTDNILQFSKSVRKYKSIEKYSDALFRYMQAIDRKNKGELKEAFQLLTQSTQSVKNYDRFLAHAIISIANFNRNDFNCPSSYRIPLLNDALQIITNDNKSSIKIAGIEKQLPIDHASEFILREIVAPFNSSNLNELEQKIDKIDSTKFSRQDTQKLYLICWRKAVSEENTDAADTYYRKIKYDDAFATILRDDHDH